jgi:hypothetical protein
VVFSRRKALQVVGRIKLQKVVQREIFFTILRWRGQPGRAEDRLGVFADLDHSTASARQKWVFRIRFGNGKTAKIDASL